MSKRAPSDVVEHRISLQDKLSTQLDSLVTASTVKDYADSIDKLASFENLYVIVTALELVTGQEILPGTPNDAVELIDMVRTWWRTGTGEGSPVAAVSDFFKEFVPWISSEIQYYPPNEG